MTDTAESLDPLRLPLIGERLIEASAGTGKTFTIAALYLRLLLGLGGEAAYPRAISVEELLVVTFTEAATEELRGRIRSNIHELRIACLRGESDNPLYSALLAEIADKDDAAKTLLLAERQMDEAAVFTIHGFCQRMLSLNAFESGMLFEQQLIEDESRLRYQACADFWRRHCYPLTRDIAAVIHDVWKGPRDLLKSLDRWLQGEAPQLKSPPAPNETLAERHQQIIARIDSLKQQWREQVGEIEGVLENSGLDRRKFNRGNQGKWMEKVNAWAQEETLSYQLPDALEKFAQSFLLERTKAGGEPPVHPLFSAVESLLASSLTLTDLVLARAMVEIRDAVAREKRRRGELGFDDMLSRLDEALRGDSGETLASAIRQRFPVAMIDEFQDTDPQQYRIFRRIWRRQPETALLLIGDPKQAIYAFRGADIFTYMKARGDVAAHYTLDTNWRSSPGMVGSVNRLFSLSDNPFMFHEIPFLPVKAAAKNKGLRFTVDAADVPAMNVWLMPGDTVGSGDYQTFMAQLCATQIRDWLSAGQQGRALLWRGETSRPVQASDITVLVRNRLEAAQVREALQTLGIPSVYLSNRDSVFETLEAQELLWLLQAVLAPLPADAREAQRWLAERLLAQMGFTPAVMEQQTATLSGGQHTRLLLARALIRQPDLLLLDEPGNHLDLPTLLWLESFLQTWQGSFVLVSHDNTLLDAVTNASWILRDQTLHSFALPCSAARQALQEQDESAALRHKAEQKEIDRVSASARRLATWGRVYDNEDLARKAKQMEKQVARLKDEQTELSVGPPWRLVLQGDALPADRLLEMDTLPVSPAPGQPSLFTTGVARLRSGDRVAIMGRNGGGKSSLLRLLWQQMNNASPLPGLRLHPRLHPGYYDQTLAQLPDEASLLALARRIAQGDPPDPDDGPSNGSTR